MLQRDRIRGRWPLTEEEIRSFCHYLSTVGEEVWAERLPAVIHDGKLVALLDLARIRIHHEAGLVDRLEV